MRRVWLIDADHWPRALLRAELLERGYDVIGFERVDDAILRLAVERQRRPELVIIDVEGLEVSRSALRLLGAGGARLLGIVGVGCGETGRLEWTELLRRPVTLGQVADVVERILP